LSISVGPALNNYIMLHAIIDKYREFCVSVNVDVWRNRSVTFIVNFDILTEIEPVVNASIIGHLHAFCAAFPQHLIAKCVNEQMTKNHN